VAKIKDGDVFLVKTSDRELGIKSLLNNFDLKEYNGKRVALKANFNSADPFPASTHIETLGVIVNNLKKADASEITLAERSGMGKTRKNLESLGIIDLSDKLGYKVVVLDEESKDNWVKINKQDTHWIRGFHISKIVLNADKVVQTCCLKTHRFGGHFTISLKNSVGLVAKRLPKGIYDYMWELHASPYQRLMVAEINKFYNTDLVILDAITAFVNEGPDSGDIVRPNLLLAGRDRVAIDAVGVAILRSYGSTKNVMDGKIFELDQLRRAAELDLGVKSASEIRLIPCNDESSDVASKLTRILEKEG
jgi:uncharacterized protein (DUF362 family)